MDRLKLKYVIELVSNLGDKARSDADRLAAAQRHIREALQGTNREIGLTERALLRLGGVHSQSINRQADYLARLAMRYHEVRRAAESAVSVMTKAAQIGAGVAAGAYATDRVTQAPMDYNTRLAYMSNTAYANRDKAGRLTGKKTLDAAIRAAVRVGGGTVDSAASALEFMISSGGLGDGEEGVTNAIKMLPSIVKTSKVGKSSPEEIANIAVRALQNFKIKPEDMSAALNMVLVGGKEGGFEINNMAKWLTEQMQMGGMIGMSGLGGLQQLIAWNQASMLAAGSKDQAGTNVRDMLMELNTPHFKGNLAKAYLNDGQKLKPGERHRKIQSIDDIYLDYQSKGVGKVEATIDMMDKVMSRDKRYTELKKRLDSTSDTGDRRAITEAMFAQVKGSAIGEVFHNQQSLLAFLGVLNNRDYVRRVMSKTASSRDEVDKDFAVLSDDTGFKKEQATSGFKMAANDAFEKIAPVLNEIFDKGTKLSQEFPVLTTALVGAAGAASVLAASLGAGGLVGLLRGTGGVPGAAGLVRGAGLLGSAGAAAAAGAAGYGAGSLLYEGLLSGTSAGNAIGRGAAKVAAFFGSENAKAALQSELIASRTMRAGNSPLSPISASLALTNPAASHHQLIASGGGLPVGLGRGEIRVLVEAKEGTRAATSVMKDMPGITLNPGNTNPAGYR